MRLLFLPACVCLVTWSGATNSDPRLTLDEFTGRLATNKKVVAYAAPDEITGNAGREAVEPGPAIAGGNTDAAVMSSGGPASHPPETASELFAAIEPVAPNPAAKAAGTLPADAFADLAIEPPVPSGIVVNNGEPAGIPLPPVPKPVIARSTEEVCDTLAQSARNNNLPAPFFIRLLFQESRFDPGVVSSAGAQGIAQFMPAVASDMGVDNPFDPLQAIPASARLLRDLFQKFGNLGLAAAAYNAGPKRIADWLANKSKNKLPEETQGYVKTITGRPVENWSAANARHPGQKLPRRAPCQDAAGLLAWNGPDTVPLPSPAPLRVAAAEAKHQAAAAKPKADKSKAEKPTVTADAKAEAKDGVNVPHHGGRVTAIIQVAKTDKPKSGPKAEHKTATQQLAARKSDLKHKSKRERVAQR